MAICSSAGVIEATCLVTVFWFARGSTLMSRVTARFSDACRLTSFVDGALRKSSRVTPFAASLSFVAFFVLTHALYRCGLTCSLRYRCLVASVSWDQILMAATPLSAR